MEDKTYEKTAFAVLSAVSVNGMTEKKGGLTYLSWRYAWAEVKKRFPFATYTVYENENGWNYFTDGRTAWVKTGVTINGLEHIEYLPIMDHRNNSIPIEKVTSQDVNKAIQRSITKRIARHGLGLYIYQGEDLPEGEEDQKPKCEACGKEVTPEIAAASMKKYGHIVCSAACRDKLGLKAKVSADGGQKGKAE